MKYYIDYGTGAGNEYVNGTIEDAIAAAKSGASYTQCSISIYNANDIGGEPVAEIPWWGVEYDPNEDENEPFVSYGRFGYYGAPYIE